MKHVSGLTKKASLSVSSCGSRLTTVTTRTVLIMPLIVDAKLLSQ